jgi:hypothetical protein
MTSGRTIEKSLGIYDLAQYTSGVGNVVLARPVVSW